MEPTKTALAFPGGDQDDDDDDKLRRLERISENNLAAANALLERTRVNTIDIAELKEWKREQEEEKRRQELSKPLTPQQRKQIRDGVSARVYSLLGLKKRRGRLDYESKSQSTVYSPLFFSRLYSDLNGEFNVSQYADIRSIDFDAAKSFVEGWKPAGGIGELKEEAEENWSIRHPGENVHTFLGRLC